MSRKRFLAKLPQLKYALESAGFARVEGFLDPAEVSRLNGRVDAWHADFAAAHGYTPTKFPFFELDPLFIELMADELIVQICAEFLGEHFRFDHPVGLQQPGRHRLKDGSFRATDERKGDLHGGPFASQGSCLVHHGNGKMWYGQFNVGFVMHDQDPRFGGFCYAPGSQHVRTALNQGGQVLNSVLEGDFFHELLVVPELKQGDLILFNEGLVHGTTPWKADGRIRRNLYFKYCPGFMAWQPYERIEKYLKLATTELQRRILRPPFTASFGDQPTVQDHIYRAPTPEPKSAAQKLQETTREPLNFARRVRRHLAGG